MAQELRWDQLLCSKRRKESHGSGESLGTGVGREEIERDYDRILFSAPLRRLADKTQVFPMEKNDSIRTRLTHSHEVSNLARSIGIRLAFAHQQPVFGDSGTALHVERTVPSLLAAIGLAHDLGNPPFGHQGEVSIQRWFGKKNDGEESVAKDFLRFDGNCQTFRLLTRLQILNDDYGLNLTYATLAGMLKYPVFWNSGALERYKKFGVFESERDIAVDVWEQTGLAEGIRHPLTYVLEACDDIAYSVIDTEDIVKKRYASFIDLVDHLQSRNGNDEVIHDVVDAAVKKNKEFRKESLSSAELDDLSMQMFRVKAIAAMVEAATEAFMKNVPAMMCGSIGKGFELIRCSKSGRLCESLKKFDREHGYRNPEVLRLELRGDTYLGETMDMLWDGIVNHDKGDPFAQYAYGRISENYRRVYENGGKKERDRCHLLCDAISGMTEQFLVALHDELKALR